MSEYKAIETTELVKIANAIRLKKGGTDKISLEDMPAMIREIEGGGIKLPALTNEAAASELLAGKQLINDEGDVITGAMADNGTIASTMDGLNIKEVTIPAGYTSGGIVSLDNTIDNEVDIQADLLAQAVAALEGKAGGGSGGGESMKYTTGTFTVTSTGGSVSGLGFTPKHVVASLASILDLPTAYTEKAVLFVQGGLCSNSVAYDVMNKSIVSGATSYGHIDILDDGFTIGTGTGVIKGTFYDGTDWNYLAIG